MEKGNLIDLIEGVAVLRLNTKQLIPLPTEFIPFASKVSNTDLEFTCEHKWERKTEQTRAGDELISVIHTCIRCGISLLYNTKLINHEL